MRLVFCTGEKYNGIVECANCRSEFPEDSDSCPRCGWQPPAEKIRFAQLKRIFSGRYDFLRLLGIGGFAEVYLARDLLLERDVAIKILLPQHAKDPQTVERFLREARLYAKLEHPNIIPIYDTGVLQELVFITMKYIRGESLKQALVAQTRIEPRLLPAIAGGVAGALAYIHRQGIVHRDIKPANIIVEDATQNVYLADFGIARADSSQTLTQTGMIVGTPHYLSPEQIQGKRIDSRSDIYALGATLYELASGQPPFRGDSPLEILYQHINEMAEPLDRLVPGINPVLVRIISRCIAKEPSRRFQNAEEIIPLIERSERSRAAAQERTVLTATTAARRNPRGARILAGAGLIAALAGAVYLLWLRPPPETPAHHSPSLNADIRNEAAAARPQNGAGTAATRPSQIPVEDGTPGTDAASPEVPPVNRQPQVTAAGENAEIPATAQTKKNDPGTIAGKPQDKTGIAATAAAAAAGTVRFSSFPPMADVIFQGEMIGNTEQVFEKKLPPGEKLFTFTIPDYQSAEVRVTVIPGETAKAHHRFPPFRNFTITARPFGRIQIDGRDYGDTPQTVKLAYGEHLIRVVKAGYRPGEQTIVFDQEARNSVYFELVKEDTE